MTDKQIILAKIDKRMAEWKALKEHVLPSEERLISLCDGRMFELGELRKFIDSMPKEPASEDLEEEISKTAEELFDEFFPEDGDLITPSDFRNGIKKVAKHFANWQKQQIMKEAFAVKVMPPLQYPGQTHLCGSFAHYRAGDKVKLIIVKED